VSLVLVDHLDARLLIQGAVESTELEDFGVVAADGALTLPGGLSVGEVFPFY
jgi:hypothetical protein